MKVLVVGGIARSLINFRGPLLKAMNEAGHEVLACSGERCEQTERELLNMGVRYFPVPMARAGLNPLQDCKTFIALKRLIRKENPDHILAYTVKPVIYTNLAAGWSRTARVYSMITGLGYAFGAQNYYQRFVGKLVHLLYKISLKKTGVIFFQNPDDRNDFSDLGLLPSGTPVTIINGSGVDLNRYSPQPLSDKPTYLLIARLLVDKGVREYVGAARSLRKQHPGARFRIAGSIDSNPLSIGEEELQAWINEGIVEYLGVLDDVRTALTDTMVYVLPSYREGTPRTVLEAMALGRPIVTTDAPGCRETVVDGVNGFLVSSKDENALANAMKKFIDDPTLAAKMGRASLNMVREKYDVHKVNRTIMEVMGL